MKKNDKVIYSSPSDGAVKWGANEDPRLFEYGGIRTSLIENGTYTVDEVEVHSWHTKITIKEFPGVKFNSISFSVVSTV